MLSPGASQTTSKAAVGPRMTAPHQVAPPKAPLTTNFQIPPGTVLIRSGNGQLMLVSQQALARAQAQVQTATAKTTALTPATTVQICTVQGSRTPLQSNLANNNVKTVPLSAAITTVPLTPTFQRCPSVMQCSNASTNVVKVSSAPGCRPNTTPSVPTVVKICKPSTQQAVGPSHGNTAIIIRAHAPDLSAVSTCSRAVTLATTATPASVTTTSVMAPGTSPITVLPIRTSTPLITPMTINACTSDVIPASTVTLTSASASTLPATVKCFTSSGTTVIKTLGPSLVQTPAANCSSAVAGTLSTVVSPAIVQAPQAVSPAIGNKVPAPITVQIQTAPPPAPNATTCKVEPAKVTQSMLPSNSTEVLDNVKKCKNFLATLIKLASSGPQSPTMGQNVKNLVKNLLDSEIEPEEFTAKLYKELKSSPQPYLVPFLKKSLPALRRLMPNSQEFVVQCGYQATPTSLTGFNTPSFVKIAATSPMHTLKQVGTTTGSIKVHHTTSAATLPVNTLKTVNIRQVVVQQPSGGIVKHAATLPQTSALTVQKPGENRITLNTLIQAGHLSQANVKQITLPGNKVLSLQATPLPIKENVTACFREEDDINDVTSMAGVNLNEENACILATNSQFVGTVIRSCPDEPFLFTSALQNRILDIGKRHDIKELNSDVMNLVSHATQERLRGLIEKLTVAAQHRSMNYKQSDRYLQSSDVRAQLKFLEQLEQLEKQRKSEEEREMLLRAAKSRSNKEDPEQLRLKQKAKEMQQLELEQIQYREANLTALAAIGPRRKRPLDSKGLQIGLEDLHAPGTFGLSKPSFLQRITRVGLRDLIFCMEQDKEMRFSLSLYRALLK
ncbi:transcription initiation factor TFIID subunit 4B [Pelodytes ibericus]